MTTYPTSHTVALDLLSRFQAAFATSPTVPARYQLRPGTTPAIDAGPLEDLCCVGVVMLLMGTSKPVDGQENLSSVANLVFEQDYLVYVTRCTPSLKDNGQLPTDAEYSAHDSLICDDRERLMSTIIGFNDTLNLAVGDLSNVSVQPMEPLGGCDAMIATFTLRITQDC